MKIFKKKVSLDNLNFSVLLTQNIKDLGLLEDISTDLNSKVVSTKVKSKGTSKLQNVRSFDFNDPYKVGVNGVIEVGAEIIKYVIDDVIYETNKVTGDTSIEIINHDTIYDKVNFIRNENSIGLSDKVNFENNVNIDRPSISVIENFSKIQQIGNPEELKTFYNNFYKVFDETL